jgi:hypothetical protein
MEDAEWEEVIPRRLLRLRRRNKDRKLGKLLQRNAAGAITVAELREIYDEIEALRPRPKGVS